MNIRKGVGRKNVKNLLDLYIEHFLNIGSKTGFV